MEKEPLLRSPSQALSAVAVSHTSGTEGSQSSGNLPQYDHGNVQQRYGALLESLEGNEESSAGGGGSQVKAEDLQVYRRRWYILAVFSGVAFMQGGLGNVWVVIAQSTETAFGWTDATVSLMQNWMYLTYLVGFLPFAWLIDRHGNVVI